MSHNKKEANDPEIVNSVLSTYRNTTLTQSKVAELCCVSLGTVLEILHRELPRDEFKRLKSLRYRNSKLGDKNPAKGKHPPNYIGDFDDGKGYKKRYVGDVQHFVHRIAVAEAIGISVGELPSEMEVHHIDRNPLNNSLSNLALVSKVAHRKLHAQLQESDRLQKRLAELESATQPNSAAQTRSTPPVRKRRPPAPIKDVGDVSHPPVRRRTFNPEAASTANPQQSQVS